MIRSRLIKADRFWDAFFQRLLRDSFFSASFCSCVPVDDAMKLRIVGLGGSLRPNSSSSRALLIALRFLSAKGHETTPLLLSELRLPGFETCERLEDYTESVHRLLNHTRSADAVIFSTPVYHGTLSGEIKNAMDFFEYLSDDPVPYLTGKVIGLVSTSGGSPGINAINTMDYVSRALHGWVCPTTIAIPSSNKQFDEEGNLKDQKLLARIERMTNELEFAAERFKTP
jgi:FMN reductase